jgi:hypothetical protein
LAITANKLCLIERFQRISRRPWSLREKPFEAKGMKKVETGNPYAAIQADASSQAKNAWFNFRYAYGVMWSDTSAGGEHKAAAVHNFKRSCALMQLSLKELGALPTGAADCTK